MKNGKMVLTSLLAQALLFAGTHAYAQQASREDFTGIWRNNAGKIFIINQYGNSSALVQEYNNNRQYMIPLSGEAAAPSHVISSLNNKLGNLFVGGKAQMSMSQDAETTTVTGSIIAELALKDDDGHAEARALGNSTLVVNRKSNDRLVCQGIQERPRAIRASLTVSGLQQASGTEGGFLSRIRRLVKRAVASAFSVSDTLVEMPDPRIAQYLGPNECAEIIVTRAPVKSVRVLQDGGLPSLPAASAR